MTLRPFAFARCFAMCLAGTALLAAASFPLTAPAESIWPGFRGTGDSQAPADGPPISWQSPGRGEGNWSIRLPGYGQSSPVVWHDRVFVTAVSGAEKEHLHVLGVSMNDGAIQWQRDFSGTQRVPDRDTVSRGAPTPVVDDGRVYCVFESGDVVALTHDGDVLWQRSFVAEYGEVQGPHGYASSPALVDDLLIIQVAHSGPSYVLALDAATGENRWRVDHPSQTGWSSPVAFEHEEGRGVILSTAGSVRALDTREGEELWRFEGVQGNSTASPTIAGDLVIIGVGEPRGGGDGGPRGGGRRGEAGGPRGAGEAPTARSPRAETAEASASQQAGAPQAGASQEAAPSEEPGTLAIRLGGRGDVTQTHVAWRAPRVTTGYASPVVAGDTVFVIKKAGVVQCVDLATGELRRQQRLPGETWATPVAVGKHIVFFTKSGAVAALDTENPDAEPVESSISATDVVYGVAATENSWIVRTGRSLLRIAGE